MAEPLPRSARKVILWLWALTLIGWVLAYFFLIAPRQARVWYVHAVILFGGAALTAVVFVNPLRGHSLLDLSERQQYWHVGSTFWVALAFFALAPLSIDLAVVVAGAMGIGSFIYVHFVREK